MSTLQKILNKRKEEEGQKNTTKQNEFTPTQQQPVQNQIKNSNEATNTYFSQLSQNNPQTFQFTSHFFPASSEIHQKSKMPYGVFFPPFADHIQPIELRTDRIPRCLACRAYMNLYNKFTSNGTNFICSFCSKENSLMAQYHCKMENGDRIDRYSRGELHLPVYSSNPPDIYYNQPPPQSVLVFMIDISSSSYQSQMIFYCVNAIKEVLSNPDFDDHLIFFYTFDEHVHQYNLGGTSPERRIIDSLIQQPAVSILNREVSFCRDNLFLVLDSLEQLSQSNDRQKSNFNKAFNYVFDCTKDYSPKIFICQSNQTFIAQEIALQKDNKGKVDPTANKKSKLQTSNPIFYSKYISAMISKNVSISYFCFAKQFRNLKIFSDTFKLTNSELFYYQKDSKQQALKFYYDLYNVISANYLQQFKTEFIVSQGWSISATYSNMYRQQKSLVCKLNNLSDQKSIGLTFTLAPNTPNVHYFILQVISSYCWRRSRRVTITTLIKPTTNSLLQIFSNTDYNCLVALNFRIGLSMLRMEESISVRNQIIKRTAHFYMALKSIFKDKIPTEAISVVQGALSFIKNQHCHVQSYTGTALLDRIISERNLLQCVGSDQLSTYFLPFVFNVSKMQAQDCEVTQQGFVYPPTVALSFNSISNGIFLMDCSVNLYLFIAKFHDTQQLYQLFGVQKLSKDVILTQQHIQNQNTTIARKVTQLINNIRQRKSYGYIPLYIIKCGQSSAKQMGFYLNFTNEKYQEFKNYQMNLNEFIDMLHTQVATTSFS